MKYLLLIVLLLLTGCAEFQTKIDMMQSEIIVNHQRQYYFVLGGRYDKTTKLELVIYLHTVSCHSCNTFCKLLSSTLSCGLRL